MLRLAVALVCLSGLTTAARGNIPFVPPDEYLRISFPEHENGPRRISRADKFEKIVTLFESGDRLLVWSTAHPPSPATRTVVSGLFALAKDGDRWRLTDAKRFESAGKSSGSEAALTSVGRGCPCVTVTLHQGGRGYGWAESASYVLEDGKFRRLTLERGRESHGTDAATTR